MTCSIGLGLPSFSSCWCAWSSALLPSPSSAWGGPLVEHIIFAVLLAGLLWSARYNYKLGVLDGYIAARWDARTDDVRKILARHGLKTHNERASEGEHGDG